MSTPRALFAEARRLLAVGDADQAEIYARRTLSLVPDSSSVLHLLGQVLYRQQRYASAAASLLAAVRLDPKDTGALNSLGAALYAADLADQGEPFLALAAALAPNDAAIRLNHGNTLRRLKRLADAEAAYVAGLEANPGHPDLTAALATVLAETGRMDAAENMFTAALSAQPDHFEALYHYGVLLHERGRIVDAANSFAAALALEANNVPALHALGLAQQAMGDTPAALATLEKARYLAPENREVDFSLRVLRSSLVPAWHIPMINDHERNDAYDQALQKAVLPGDIVLEIGTGSALVAMMAARAGAGHVYTCELNPSLAEAAMRTVKRNKMDDKVSVIHRKSTDMTVPGDMPEKADVFVSELINVGMLAPEMLKVLRHARETLVKPGGKVIPAASTIHAMLIQCDSLKPIYPVGMLNGFDMSEMDAFRSPGYCQIDLAAEPHRRLSDDVSPLYFDFTRDMPECGEEIIEIEAKAIGMCHGIAFWFDLHMFDDVLYQSGSRNRQNHWKQAMEFFDEPVHVVPGQIVRVAACWDSTRISFRRV